VRGDALPAALALVVFDGTVNHGVSRAIKLLQQVLRVTVDGVLGPETLSAAKLFQPRHELVVLYLDARRAFYDTLAQQDPDRHGGSLLGWRRRLWRLALEAGRWRGL
jgi:lysozyme family protein